MSDHPFNDPGGSTSRDSAPKTDRARYDFYPDPPQHVSEGGDTYPLDAGRAAAE